MRLQYNLRARGERQDAGMVRQGMHLLQFQYPTRKLLQSRWLRRPRTLLLAACHIARRINLVHLAKVEPDPRSLEGNYRKRSRVVVAAAVAAERGAPVSVLLGRP